MCTLIFHPQKCGHLRFVFSVDCSCNSFYLLLICWLCCFICLLFPRSNIKIIATRREQFHSDDQRLRITCVCLMLQWGNVSPQINTNTHTRDWQQRSIKDLLRVSPSRGAFTQTYQSSTHAHWHAYFRLPFCIFSSSSTPPLRCLSSLALPLIISLRADIYLGFSKCSSAVKPSERWMGVHRRSNKTTRAHHKYVIEGRQAASVHDRRTGSLQILVTTGGDISLALIFLQHNRYKRRFIGCS